MEASVIEGEVELVARVSVSHARLQHHRLQKILKKTKDSQETLSAHQSTSKSKSKCFPNLFLLTSLCWWLTSLMCWLVLNMQSSGWQSLQSFEDSQFSGFFDPPRPASEQTGWKNSPWGSSCGGLKFIVNVTLKLMIILKLMNWCYYEILLLRYMYTPDNILWKDNLL